MNTYDDVDENEDAEKQLPRVSRTRLVAEKFRPEMATMTGTLATLWHFLDELGTTLGMMSLLRGWA
jgi:hypothetical protein